jgi:acyl-coenzyme A synthetase/AMP-(fatty) acid ligase
MLFACLLKEKLKTEETLMFENKTSQYFFPFLQKNNKHKINFYIHNKPISNEHLVNDIHKVKSNLSFLSWQKVALCFQDSYLFTVSLFACLLSNVIPILLPNNQPGTIQSLGDEFDGILNEDKITTYLKAEIEHDHIALPENREIILFTSGSTGKPKKVTRTLKQLMSEIDVLQSTFYKGVQLRNIFSTVSHQHIYGLLFFILWPLAKQYHINLPILNYPEQLENLTPTKNTFTTLISSPALLKRIDKNVDNSSVSTIFSSGGQLDITISESIFKAFKQYPIEVFGSTETGGIAYRMQDKGEDWKIFKNVKIKIKKNQTLVNSPFFTNDNNYISIGDQIALDKNSRTFKHIGRTDSIVKIEEKRLSLTDMEYQIRQHKFVQDCKLIALNNNRQYIAAVIELNTLGNINLNQKNKLIINRELQFYLKSYYDNILIPKKFRYVDQIPINSQGKTILSEIKALFETRL